MSTENITNHSINFGKKEKVENYACQTYQLSRPNKVGLVMALIKECQPQSYEDWHKWYLENVYSVSRTSKQTSEESLNELGARLYEKIINVVIPECLNILSKLTVQDCIDYICNITNDYSFNNYFRVKSVVNDGLAKIFKDITFNEITTEPELAGDIDYVANIGDKAFGIQIKPVTANANFAGYKLTERMQHSFDDFTDKYGGQVFVVFSNKGEIANAEVIDKIKAEIERLKAIQ